MPNQMVLSHKNKANQIQTIIFFLYHLQCLLSDELQKVVYLNTDIQDGIFNVFFENKLESKTCSLIRLKGSYQKRIFRQRRNETEKRLNRRMI